MLNRDLVRRIVQRVRDHPGRWDVLPGGVDSPCIVELMHRFEASPAGNTDSTTTEELATMAQHAQITGDDRFADEARTISLIPGLHGVGLHDGRKVSIVRVGDAVHAIESAKVEVWTTQEGHPASGLAYQVSDRGRHRVVVINHAEDRVRVVLGPRTGEEGDADIRSLQTRYRVRVHLAIESLEGN